MKLKVEQDRLAGALQAVMHTVGASPSRAELTGVLLEAPGRNSLRLTTTDLEVTSRMTIDAEVSEQGAVLVPAKRLNDIVKNLKNQTVSFEAGETGKAKVKCAKYRGGLRLLDAALFPAVETPAGSEAALEAAEFARAVSQVTRAASRDESRPLLTGVLVEFRKDPDRITIVATDTNRLAVRSLNAKVSGAVSIVVPHRALLYAGAAASNDETVKIYATGEQAVFQVGAYTLTTRLLIGKYPDWRTILPREHANKLAVSRVDLVDAVRRVATVGDGYSPVQLKMGAKGIRLTLQSAGVGDGDETVEGDYVGEESVAQFNADYLSAGLEAVTTERVHIETDGLKPAIVRGDKPDEDNFTYIIMPMRLPAQATEEED